MHGQLLRNRWVGRRAGLVLFALLPSLSPADQMDDDAKLERVVAVEERAAESDLHRMSDVMKAEINRSNTERSKGHSREFIKVLEPSIKSKTNLSDPRVPLRKRIVEKQRQDLVQAYILLDKFYRGYAACDPIPVSLAIWERPDEQAALLAAVTCFRGTVEHFLSEMNLEWDDQRQRLRQLHLPQHSERLRIHLSEEEEERHLADWNARFDPQLKYWQSMEDVLVYVKAHPIKRTANGLNFSTQDELLEFRRLISAMNVALKAQNEADAK